MTKIFISFIDGQIVVRTPPNARFTAGALALKARANDGGVWCFPLGDEEAVRALLVTAYGEDGQIDVAGLLDERRRLQARLRDLEVRLNDATSAGAAVLLSGPA